MVSQEGTKTIDQSSALDEFGGWCDKYYVCYAVASMGIKQTYERLKASKANPHRTLHVGDGPPGPGKADAAVNIGEYLEGHESGEFLERIARSFVVTIYTEWDDVWRRKIADEHGVQSKDDVECDLMGDLRKIRHLIVHNNRLAHEWNSEFEVLDWTVEPGTFRISGGMLKGLIAQIDEMQVRLKTNS